MAVALKDQATASGPTVYRAPEGAELDPVTYEIPATGSGRSTASRRRRS
jgi:hypothetical protein